MWYVTSLLLLIALASEVLAGTPVKSCKDAPPITESNAVTISGCDEAPCKLEKKSSTDLHFKFKVDKETETVTNKVSAKIGPMDMPFIGVDGTDACSLIFLGDGSPASCPLKEGVEYVYRNSISVSEMYPKIKTVVTWSIVNDSENPILCFTVPASIVSASNKQ